MIKCSVESCNSNLSSGEGSEISFFDFPQWEDSERFLKWADALGKPPEHFKEKNAYVCSRHFRQEDLIAESLPQNLVFDDIKFRLRLSEGAVPSQNLSENKIFHNFSETSVEQNFSPFITYPSDFCTVKKEEENDNTSLKDSNSIPQNSSYNSHFSTLPQKNLIGSKDIKVENMKKEEAEEKKESCLILKISDEKFKISRRKKYNKNKKEISKLNSNASDVAGEKEFVCKNCGEKFAWINQLRRHRRRFHAVVKCDICFKLLANEGGIKAHKMSKHNINFVFNCQLCDKAFIKSKELLTHSRIHRSIERLECYHCKKKFTTEEEIKNKKCENCSKKIKCCICGKILTGEIIFNSHLIKKHSTKLTKKTNVKIFCFLRK